MNANRARGPSISLTPSQIHLWLAFYDEIVDEPLHAACRELLSAAEKEQEQRFYFARDRRRYLVTRAMVRTVLSRYVAIDPADWRFTTNSYGRPEIVNEPAQEAGLVFNISHTQGLIVLGVSKRRSLGVDVENFSSRKASIDLARSYFAPEEAAVVTSAPVEQQQFRFFEFWTFKEAYIKARGLGLFLPLDKFSFHCLIDGVVDLAIDPELNDDPGRWQFWQFRPAPDYLLAICAERLDEDNPQLSVRQFLPFLSEQESTPAFSRRSQHLETSKRYSTTGDST